MSNNANPPDGGSGNATPSERIDDNFEFLDFDEQDREEKPVNAKPGDDETDDQQETTEAESQEVENPEGETEGADESEPEGEEADKPEPADDVTVKLPTGEAVALAELKNGYMRDRDYRIKTTQVAETRRNLEAQANRVTQTVDVLADFLAKQIPPEPDPALLYSDPQAHYRQRAIYDAAIAQINAVIELGAAPKEAVNNLTQQQRSEILATENARMAERFPMTTKEQGRKEFFDRALKAAAYVGMSASEVANETDHRRLGIAYLASLGMEALEAKKTAQQKVKGVPSVSPPRRQAQSNAVATAKNNQEAMKRLAKTGSLKDALSIDFD
jgi:hypothetical protein